MDPKSQRNISYLSLFSSLLGIVLMISDRVYEFFFDQDAIPISAIAALTALVFVPFIYLQWKPITRYINLLFCKVGLDWQIVSFLVAVFVMTLSPLFVSLISSKVGVNSQIVSFLMVVFATILSLLALTTFVFVYNFSKSNATIFIGQFPDNINKIIEILDEAKNEIKVVVDLAAYGGLSNPLDHKAYKNLLENKARAKINVKMLIHTNDLVEKLTEDQFRKQTETTEKQQIFFESDLLLHFLDNNKRYSQPKSMQDFIKIVQDENRKAEIDLRNNGVLVERHSERFPVFLWVIDRRKAVFSFYNMGTEAREVSFLTRDSNIIKMLAEIFESHKLQRKRR